MSVYIKQIDNTPKCTEKKKMHLSRLTWAWPLPVRVLSLRASVIHGFVTEPWHSRHVLFSRERAASSVLSRLLALFHVGAWCWPVRVLMALCIHVVMSCVNTWLMSFLISCVFVSCFAHGWWFVCWPCACVFVLCEHVASVLVFCVPCALCQLSWPHPSCFLIIG